MAVIPLEIRRLGASGVRIQWSDGVCLDYSSRLLRTNCPCATCRERRGDDSHAAPLTPKKSSLLRIVEASADTELSLERIWSVGNYALGLAWADGHDTGIYPFDLLRKISLEPSSSSS